MSRRPWMPAGRRVTTAAVVGAGLVSALAIAGCGGDPYRVDLELTDAGGLRIHSDVKVAGVRAGQVKSMRVTDQDRAIIGVEIDPAAAPIGKGARARVRPVNLLGEKYVDLEPGDTSTPVASGSTISVANTSNPVELDDVLNALDPDVRARLRMLINEAGIGLFGRGADVNRLLATLPSTTEELGETIADVNGQARALREMIGSAERVTSVVGRRADELGAFVATADRALAPLARRRAELGATVRAAPGALRTLRGTLDTLDDTATKLVGTSRQVRAAAPPLAGTLQALPGFTDAAAATLVQARLAAPSITRLATRATPALRRLAPTTERLRTVARQTAPVTTTLDTGAGDDVLRLMENWARTITGRDGLGHVFRTHLAIDTQMFGHALERLTPSPAKRKRATGRRRPSSRPAPDRPPVTVPSVPRPALPTVDRALESVRDGVGRLLDALPRDGKGQPPAASDDVGGLLDSLLGP